MMTHKDIEDPIIITGAGPAGLSAAITALHQDNRVIIYERQADVGHRFHGDFQGLENWTTDSDVLDELGSIGIEISFGCTPFYEVVLFDPDGRKNVCRSTKPLFYLVRRGTKDSLDFYLKQQVLNSGVEIRFNSICKKMPDGGIVAQGPHRADVIAVGYLFETPNADGAYVALSDKLAPQGYAYLLIHNGRGTIASCMFNDFHNENDCLMRTVEFFNQNAGLVMKNKRHFGGTGNFSIPDSAHKNRILYAGETAGFQDAFAGFGLRYAMLSGHYAAKSLLDNAPGHYDYMWKKRLLGLMRASVVNRYMYAMFGDFGYRNFVKGVAHSKDARNWIRKRYHPDLWKSIIYPFAQHAFNRRLKGMCVEANCHCTWCRCQHDEK